ncbi:MAG TPA: LysE family transporter [Candidatus Deferrimicrobiaceae bacterium]|nr:LysE family transporter [Candidatus Deferrimicrobiaceae bacterium]
MPGEPAALIGPLLAGMAAGYAVAIPVGAIAVLIVETGLRDGFRQGAVAAAGAATADGLYATLAALGGAAVAGAVAPWVVPLRAAAVVVLLAIAARGFLAARASAAPLAGERAAGGLRSTYLRLLGLTILNPMTVVYFAALVLALPVLEGGPLARPTFAVAAFAASLSWQLLLAAGGAVAHRRLPARFRVWLSLVGNGVIVAFALLIARDLL